MESENFQTEKGHWNLIVMGCGSSSSVPNLRCILDQDQPNKRKCSCMSDDIRNYRLNPSIVLSRRISNEPSDYYNVV